MQKMTAIMPPRRNFKTTGRWHKKWANRTKRYQFKKYRTPCRMSVKNIFVPLQTSRKRNRSDSTQVEENNKRYQENPQLYRTRQEINEHIFGTIKKTMGL
jgi:hypothetical protein